MTVRPRRAPARRWIPGVLGAFAVALVGVAAGPVGASGGIFVYTDTTTGLPGALIAPEELKCITAKGSGARNFTSSDVILYTDAGCERYLILLVPGESLNLPFDSVGFAPPCPNGCPRP